MIPQTLVVGISAPVPFSLKSGELRYPRFRHLGSGRLIWKEKSITRKLRKNPPPLPLGENRIHDPSSSRSDALTTDPKPPY